MFPFHSRLHQNKHKLLCIILHIVGILIPVPGIIGAFLDGGYSIEQFPPIICNTRNPAVFYYSTVFTINILGIVAMDMLIIIVWTVRLVSLLFGNMFHTACMHGVYLYHFSVVLSI